MLAVTPAPPLLVEDADEPEPALEV